MLSGIRSASRPGTRRWLVPCLLVSALALALPAEAGPEDLLHRAQRENVQARLQEAQRVAESESLSGPPLDAVREQVEPRLLAALGRARRVGISPDEIGRWIDDGTTPWVVVEHLQGPDIERRMGQPDLGLYFAYLKATVAAAATKEEIRSIVAEGTAADRYETDWISALGRRLTIRAVGHLSTATSPHLLLRAAARNLLAQVEERQRTRDTLDAKILRAEEILYRTLLQMIGIGTDDSSASFALLMEVERSETAAPKDPATALLLKDAAAHLLELGAMLKHVAGRQMLRHWAQGAAIAAKIEEARHNAARRPDPATAAHNAALALMRQLRDGATFADAIDHLRQAADQYPGIVRQSGFLPGVAALLGEALRDAEVNQGTLAADSDPIEDNARLLPQLERWLKGPTASGMADDPLFAELRGRRLELIMLKSSVR